MKKTLLFMIIVMFSFAMSKSFAQDEKTKSSTTSTLVVAQAETFKAVFDSLYNIDDKVDINKVYATQIAKKTAGCLEEDLILWGEWVIGNAQNGKFKKYRLSFEKPENSTFKVPGKAKRTYKKAFKKAKKDFISTRKSKTITQIMEDKNLKKYLGKTNKAFIRQKNKWLRKIVK